MLSGVFRLYSFRKADGAKGSAGRKTLASFCLNPIASSRGQSMLLSEACSCSAERRTRGPIIEIFKLPAVSRIRVRWRPPASVPYTSLSTGLRLDTFGMKLRHRRLVRRIRDKTLESRSARLDKPVRKTPVLVSIGRDLSIGYRRNETAGTWMLRKADAPRLYGPPTLGPNCRLQRGVQPI